MLVSLISSLSGETRNSVGMARLPVSQSDMFLVEPDNLDTKTLTWFSIYHALLADLMAKRQLIK